MENLMYRAFVRVPCWRRWVRLVAISTMVLAAQSGDWAQVKALTAGTTVEVKRFSGGGEIRGTIESVSEDLLVVQAKQNSLTFDRAEIRRVRLRSNEKTKSGRATGAAALGGLGVLSAGISDGGGGGKAASVGILAGLGYLIGWAVDGPKRITIYKAPKR